MASTRKSKKVSKKSSNFYKFFNRYKTPGAILVALLFGIVGTIILLKVSASSIYLAQEDFSTSASNFTTVKGGTWAVDNGQYKLSAPASPTDPNVGNANYAIHKVNVSGDFAAEVDFNITPTDAAYNDASLIFNWVDPSNYMYASFNETANDTTNGIFKIINGTQTRLASFSTTYAPGLTHHARIERTGSTYTITVNGVQAGQTTDTSLTQGRVGFGSRNDAVNFDNFNITQPDTQLPTVSLQAPSNASGLKGTISLAANASDNLALAKVDFIVDSTVVGSVTQAPFTYSWNTATVANGNHTLKAKAYDTSGNVQTSNYVPVTVANVNLSNTAFKHPGIMVSKPQLDFVKSKLQVKAQPWTDGYSKIYTRFRNVDYKPRAVSTIDCSASATNCANMVDDADAAYALALQYYYSTGTTKNQYAQASIRILNAWSSTLKSANGNQAKLEMAWTAETMSRAAEIVRYTYTPASGETPFNITAFSSLLKNVFLPQFNPTNVAVTSSNGNWHLSMIDATMDIGVFTDDKSIFDSAVTQWRQRVPAYIYVTSDGSSPATPPGGLYNTSTKLNCFWLAASNSPTSNCSIPSGAKYVNGMVQETCRDAGHVALGMSSLIYAAETARLQGVDLYGEQQNRIVSGLEMNAGYQNTYLSTGKYPSSPCGGTPQNGDGGAGWKFYWEVAYNQYHNRKGVSMPNTQSMLTRVRSTGGANQDVFETLTHADSGSVALPQ